MASAFARSARHSFRAGANAFRQSASSSSSSARSAAHCPSRCPFLMQNSVPRRRILQSAIPLHNAVAAAKLVSHLSTSSRSSSALSLVDPLSYMHPILACNFLKTSMSKLHRCWTTSKSLLLTLSRNIFSKSNKLYDEVKKQQLHKFGLHQTLIQKLSNMMDKLSYHISTTMRSVIEP